MTAKKEKILIIGGGIAGLSAGCYAQMNGYEAHIFESHYYPGGLCTSWSRKGFTFDGSLHWLVGSGKTSGFHQMWRDLGAIQGRTFIDHDEFIRFKNPQGRDFVLYTNIDLLEAHLKDIAPEDEIATQTLISDLRIFARINYSLKPSINDKNIFFKIISKIIPFLNYKKFKTLPKVYKVIKRILTLRKMSVEDYAFMFKNKFVRDCLYHSFGELEQIPIIVLLATLAMMHKREAGYPLGGSLAFSQSIADRFSSLGGTIHYKTFVTKILTDQDKACGVELKNGEKVMADYVISAADGFQTIFNLLDGKFLDQTIKNRYKSDLIFPPLIHICLGINGEIAGISDETTILNFPLKEKVLIAGKMRTALQIHCQKFDSSLAPLGKQVAKVILLAEPQSWSTLKEGSLDDYKSEKKIIVDQVCKILDEEFPGLKSQIEFVDLATPSTYIRYTHNWQGTFEGWLPTVKNLGKSYKKTLPGLKNFYMCGHWLEPGGGVPLAAASGRHAIQLLCRSQNKKFKSFEEKTTQQKKSDQSLSAVSSSSSLS